MAHRAYRPDQLQATIDVTMEVLHRGGDGCIESSEHIRKAVETAAKEVGDFYVRYPGRTY